VAFNPVLGLQYTIFKRGLVAARDHAACPAGWASQISNREEKPEEGETQ
tara:strand:- start:230 stop:376 length:147 start_codon:yes stop_codon:yes gene_type:complete